MHSMRVSQDSFFLPRWKVSFLFTYANHHEEMFRCWCLMDPWGTWSSWKNLEGWEEHLWWLHVDPVDVFTHCSRNAWNGGSLYTIYIQLCFCVGASNLSPFQWCHIFQLPCVRKKHVKLTKFSKTPEACSESHHDPALCPRLFGASPHVAAGRRSCKNDYQNGRNDVHREILLFGGPGRVETMVASFVRLCDNSVLL